MGPNVTNWDKKNLSQFIQITKNIGKYDVQFINILSTVYRKCTVYVKGQTIEKSVSQRFQVQPSFLFIFGSDLYFRQKSKHLKIQGNLRFLLWFLFKF